MFFRLSIVAIACIVTQVGATNSMTAIDPTEFTIRGGSESDGSNYKIILKLRRAGSEFRIDSAAFNIDGRTLLLPREARDRIINPEYWNVSVKYDVGLTGSFFQFSFPYVGNEFCEPNGPLVKKNRAFIAYNEGENKLNVSYWKSCGRT